MKCFDPRDGTVKESSNPALMVLEWLRGMPNDGGQKEVPDKGIDFDSAARAADLYEDKK